VPLPACGPDRRPRVNIDVQAVKGVADSGDPEADIIELVATVGAAASHQGSGAAFFLDELQFLGKRSLGLLAAAMHGISQQNTPVLLVGAGLPPLPLASKRRYWRDGEGVVIVRV
jgi:hypothetical protein